MAKRQYIHEMGAYVDDFQAGSDMPMTKDTSEEEDTENQSKELRTSSKWIFSLT